VPLLILPDAKQALELLVAKRNDAGVHADKPFVFAKVSVCTADNYVAYIHSLMLLLFLFNDPLETNYLRLYLATFTKFSGLVDIWVEMDHLHIRFAITQGTLLW